MRSFLIIALLAASAFAFTSFAQEARNRRGPGSQGPRVTSPEVSAERKITFRILAPKAETVRLSAGDIPGNGQGQALTKDTNGIWEITVGPVPAGAYRYNFNVDGVAVIDPRNPATSESNENTWSLAVVPGADFLDTKEVPHGAVAAVTYYSTVLKRNRRLHVYTPPGYELGGDTKLPVFYLLHGAGDSDDSWSSVGRAGIILDNLIAAGKAKPMLVVMPAGHTDRGRGGRGSGSDFENEFVTDIMPLVKNRYRVLDGRQNRAIAGLSMGGAQTLNIGVPHLDQFAYLGVFSSGVFGITGGGPNAPQGPSWEEKNKAVLDDPALKNGLKLFWFATGKDDFLVKTSQATVEMLKKHGFDVKYQETSGAHTWLNWRDYLQEFAPQLFQ